jgi:hypothetical protein
MAESTAITQQTATAPLIYSLPMLLAYAAPMLKRFR